jgi:drug/metabolite transporter (DMT)-like permease
MILKTRISVGNLLAIASMWVIGGLVYPLLALGSKHLNAISLMAIRSSGAAVIMTAMVLILVPKAIMKARLDRRLYPILIAAVLFYPLGSGLLAAASAHIPSAFSALIFSCLPILAVIYAVTTGNQQSKRTWAGVFLALVFLAGLVGRPSGELSSLGIIFVILSVLSWFIGTQNWIEHAPDYPLLICVWLQVLFGAIGCDLIALVSGQKVPSVHQAFSPVMLLLMISIAIQHLSYIGLSTRVPPALLTSFAFVNPLVAAVAAYFLLHERLSALQALAALGLLVAIYLVVTGEKFKVSQ